MAEKINQNKEAENDQNEWIYIHEARKVEKKEIAHFNGHVLIY